MSIEKKMKKQPLFWLIFDPITWRLLRHVAVSLIGRGVTVPEPTLLRVQEFIQMKRLLDELAINVVIDVGANRGQTAMLLRGLGFRGYIYSFEPQSHVFAILERTLRKDPKWKGFQVALGEASTSLELYVHPESDEMSSLLRFEHPQGTYQETVQVIRLDSLFSSLVESIPLPRVFLKIDTEGYDLAVFRGAANFLPNIFALQVELFVHSAHVQAPHYLDALKEYEQAGFNLVNLSLNTRAESGDVCTMNALMRRVI